MVWWVALVMFALFGLRPRPVRAAREHRLSCSRLMMRLDPARGFPHSVCLLDRYELRQGLWGDIETAFREAPPERLRDLSPRTQVQSNEAITTASGSGFHYRIVRQAHPQYLDERYEIVARQDGVLETFALYFEPRVPEFRYHWFTGEDLGFMLFSHAQDPTLHLAMALIDGKLRAYESPEGCPHVVLAYTDHRRHPESDEYPNPPIQMTAGDTLAIHFRLFVFRDMADLESKWRSLCGLPVFSYDRVIETGRRWQLEVKAPDRMKALSATLSGRRLKPRRRRSGRISLWQFETRPSQPGLQRVEVACEENGRSRSHALLFYVMPPPGELLERRCQVILRRQQAMEDASSPLYGGIFPYDCVAQRRIVDPTSPLRGGTGEMLASAILVLLKNHLTGAYEPREIRAMEIHAHQYVRLRLQRGQDESYLNPQAPYPLPYPEASTGIAWEYLELSRVPSRHLTVQNPETYLLWAYRTLVFSLTRYPDILDRPCPTVILDVLTQLENAGYPEEAGRLRGIAASYFQRLREALTRGAWHRPPARAMTALLQWARYAEQPLALKEWEKGLLELVSDLGFSYDPRLIAVFRAGAGETIRLQAPDALAMPSPETQEAARALLEAYRATGEERWLATAYPAMLNFYTLYDSDYPHNVWPGTLQPGEASSAYFPTLYYRETVHDTLDGGAAGQDGGFLHYLLSFGQECFETKSGRLFNCERARSRIIAWAPFPRFYFLKNHTLTIDPGATISWVDIQEQGDLVLQVVGGGRKRLSLQGLLADTEYVLRVGAFHERYETDGQGRLQIPLQLGPGTTEKILHIFRYDPDAREAIPFLEPGSLAERAREYAMDHRTEEPPPLPKRRRRSARRSP